MFVNRGPAKAGHYVRTFIPSEWYRRSREVKRVTTIVDDDLDDMRTRDVRGITGCLAQRRHRDGGVRYQRLQHLCDHGRLDQGKVTLDVDQDVA